jgi:hypothetical protein
VSESKVRVKSYCSSNRTNGNIKLHKLLDDGICSLDTHTHDELFTDKKEKVKKRKKTGQALNKRNFLQRPSRLLRVLGRDSLSGFEHKRCCSCCCAQHMQVSREEKKEMPIFQSPDANADAM